MRKRRLFWQLYTSNFLVIFLALFAFTFLTTSSFQSILLDQVSNDLRSRVELLRPEVVRHLRAGTYVELNTESRRYGRTSHTRITVLLANGDVVADSERDPATMENHARRPEVILAERGGYGTSTRYSSTLRRSMMYAAVPLYDGNTLIGFLRTAVPVHRVEEAVQRLQWQIVLGGLVIALIAGLVSLAISRRLTHPIETMKLGARRFAEGELDFRLEIPESEELNDLAAVMNTMAAQLQDRIGTIVQQNSEQDAVLSSMVEGVLAFDTEERLININHSAAVMLNIVPEKALGRAIQEIVRNVGLQRFVADTLSRGVPLEEFISIVEDNQERHVQLHGTLLRDHTGNILGVLVVLNDVTELRKLENVRRDFVANVSHELKTPITSIKGFVETLLDGAIHDRADAMRFLTIISKQADRLNAIIEDLLSLSRIEQGADRHEIELEERAMAEILASAAQTCQVEAEAKRATLLIDCPEEISAVVNAQLLEQAVVNLINNALKYSDEGKCVWISAAAHSEDEITVCVRDEGYGIEAEHLPRLFERFYRIDKARSRKMGGTGLGLAIVKHIVQAHRGRIEVKSSPGVGSVFTMYLPRTMDAAGTHALDEVAA